MKNECIIDRDNIFYNVKEHDREEVIRLLGEHLYNNGYVKETFSAAIAEREKRFPTGLRIGKYGIAIPHTDIKHVIKPAICVAKLYRPVAFIQMGSEREEVQVELILMLALRSPDKQIEVLKKIAVFLGEEEKTERLIAAQSEDELFCRMAEIFK